MNQYFPSVNRPIYRVHDNQRLQARTIGIGYCLNLYGRVDLCIRSRPRLQTSEKLSVSAHRLHHNPRSFFVYCPVLLVRFTSRPRHCSCTLNDRSIYCINPHKCLLPLTERFSAAYVECTTFNSVIICCSIKSNCGNIVVVLICSFHACQTKSH